MQIPFRFRLAAADGDKLYLIAGDKGDNAALWCFDWSAGGELPKEPIDKAGWDRFDHFGCDGEGKFYAVTPLGELFWYKYDPKSTKPFPRAKIKFGFKDGLHSFTHVLCGGAGVIYAVNGYGELLWYRDKKRNGLNKAESDWYNNGVGKPVGPSGRNWNQYRTLFAGRGGDLYAIDNEEGTLRKFKHLGFEDGSPQWQKDGRAILENQERRMTWHQTTNAVSGGEDKIFRFDVANYSKLLQTDVNFSQVLQYNVITREIKEKVLEGLQMSPLEGYCWPLSIEAGKTVNVMLSCIPKAECKVSLHRLRVKIHKKEAQILLEDMVPPIEKNIELSFQTAGIDGSQVGFGWKPSWAPQLLKGSTKPGLYVVAIKSPGGFVAKVPFIVKQQGPSDILVLVNTNTWNAYNDWGGPSNYSHGVKDPKQLSYLRPNPRLLDVQLDDTNGPWHTLKAELFLIDWLQQNYSIDLITDIDLHVIAKKNEGKKLERYHTLILQTHPEYWSEEMLTIVRDYLEKGGTLLYLGGNGMYRRVEFLQDSSVSKDYPDKFKTGDHNIEWFLKQRDRCLLGAQARRPEHPGWIYAHTAEYEVVMPDHWLFKNTKYAIANARISEKGVNNSAGPSGSEIDKLAEAANCGIKRIQILAKRRLNPKHPDEAKLGQMIFFETGKGGFVFSVNSIAFGGSLVVDDGLQKMFKNAIIEAKSRRNRPVTVE